MSVEEFWAGVGFNNAEVLAPAEQFLADRAHDRAAAIAAVRARPHVPQEEWQRAWVMAAGGRGPGERLGTTLAVIDRLWPGQSPGVISHVVHFLESRDVPHNVAVMAIKGLPGKSLRDWIAAWEWAEQRVPDEPDMHFEYAVRKLARNLLPAPPGSILELLERHPQRVNVSPFAAGVAASLHSAIR